MSSNRGPEVVETPSRILGVAFILQFLTSIVSGAVIKSALIVSGDIGESMTQIAANIPLMRVHILLDMGTAAGVVFLGAMLFLNLKDQNRKIALVALCMYVLEAALLACSRSDAFRLMRLSQELRAGGDHATLLMLGNIAMESMDFVGGTLHMVAFCIGAALFYSLLYASRIIPRFFSLWGLITLVPLCVGTLMAMFGYDLPFFLYVPYVPFELVIGVWILIKGIRYAPVGDG